MKRVLVVGIILATMTVSAPAGAAGSDGTKEQINEAYARVFDRSLPMRQRLASLENGAELRATLRKFDALKTVVGFSMSTVELHVRTVRAHRGDAEVQIEIFADSQMITGWSGVARQIHGRWVVARDTVCVIFAEWTPVRCPGGPKRGGYLFRNRRVAKSRSRDGSTVVPVTFADGARADVLVPPDLAKGWRIVPHAELVLGDHTAVPVYFQDGRVPATQKVRTYGAAPGHQDVDLDSMMGLVFHLDEWTAYIPAESLSEHERELVAKHLDGYTTTSGFPVLIPTGPLHFHRSDPPTATGVQLAKSALNVDNAANPMELAYSDGDTFVSVVITPGPCPDTLQAPWTSGTYRAEERCTANGLGRIAVEGNNEIVGRLLDEVQIVNYRAALATSTA